MKVSYIVTIYNKALYLPFVVHGIVNQEGTFEREFVFVDDGSTDGSMEVLNRLVQDIPDKVEIIQQENCGPSVASNRGLEVCTGDYIKFVDGDDVLLPWATKILMNVMEEGKHAYAFSSNPVAMSYDNMSLDHLDSIVSKLRGCSDNMATSIWSNPLQHVISRSHGNPTSWIAARDTVTRTGGFAEHIFVQDYVMELSLAAQGSAGIFPGPIFLYPEEDTKRVSSNKAQILHDLNMALGEVFRRWPELMDQHGFHAAKRATGRSWNFARRNRVPRLMQIRTFLNFVGVRLGFVKWSPEFFESTAKVFHEGFAIR